MKKIICTILSFLNFGLANAQDLKLTSYASSSKITFNFYNPTKDTVYLFDAYFHDDFYSSKYLHQIDKKNKIYLISFVPIVSHLSYPNQPIDDRIIIGEDRLVKGNSIKYSFSPIPPGENIRISIPTKSLFLYKNNSVTKFNPFSIVDERKIRNNAFKLDSKYKLTFGFGYISNMEDFMSEKRYDNGGDILRYSSDRIKTIYIDGDTTIMKL